MDNQRLMEVAKDIANAQGCLANSPAEVYDDGSIVLCAASCIAKAAIVLSDDLESLTDFNGRVAYEDKHTYLGNIFKVKCIDLDATSIVLENDNTPPEIRLEWFNRL